MPMITSKAVPSAKPVVVVLPSSHENVFCRQTIRKEAVPSSMNRIAASPAMTLRPNQPNMPSAGEK